MGIESTDRTKCTLLALVTRIVSSVQMYRVPMNAEFSFMEKLFSTIITYKTELPIRVSSSQMFVIRFLKDVTFLVLITNISLQFICVVKIEMLFHHCFLLEPSVAFLHTNFLAIMAQSSLCFCNSFQSLNLFKHLSQ